MRASLAPVALPNERWSLDFVHDQFTSGRRFATRECLAAIADTSISGKRVVRELKAVVTGAGSRR
jgi:hypothetical protein